MCPEQDLQLPLDLERPFFCKIPHNGKYIHRLFGAIFCFSTKVVTSEMVYVQPKFTIVRHRMILIFKKIMNSRVKSNICINSSEYFIHIIPDHDHADNMIHFKSVDVDIFAICI